MVKQSILKTEIPREKNFIYYCGTDSKGNIEVFKSPMARGRKKKKQDGNK